jgi:hypothetical protein
MRFLRPLLFFLILIIAGIIAWLGWQALTRPSVVIEWSTASELDTMGFNLYRSDQPDGDSQKINSSLIAPSADPLTGGDYQYIDRDVQGGVTYYYWLEDVDSHGFTSRNGPTQVTAESGGWLELAVAAVLALVGLYGLPGAIREARRTDSPSL